MSEILSFKMVGGEEVVAEIVEIVRENSMLTEGGSAANFDAIKSYVVRKPHILRIQPIAPGEVGLAMIAWTLSNPSIERMEIPAAAVLLTFSPSQNTVKQYIEQTSGLKLAQANAMAKGRISV